MRQRFEDAWKAMDEARAVPRQLRFGVAASDYGYRLVWVLTISTAALVVFHELAVRTGVVTGKGLIALMRARYGPRLTAVPLSALVLANLGTLCAESPGSPPAASCSAASLGGSRLQWRPSRSPRSSCAAPSTASSMCSSC